MKLLVVEDDTKVARFLTRVLTEEGYAADSCARGADALAQAATGLYDLVVLDWMLPDLDGLSVCRELRRKGIVAPVLMLTARGETGEKVLALDAGADDFVVKPFEVEELLARVRALLRRAAGAARVEVGPLRIDRLARKVLVDGQAVELTAREYALLLHLAHRLDRVVPRSELLAQVWGTTFDPSTNVIDVYIRHLREKLGVQGKRITTQRGVGYAFDAPA